MAQDSRDTKKDEFDVFGQDPTGSSGWKPMVGSSKAGAETVEAVMLPDSNGFIDPQLQFRLGNLVVESHLGEGGFGTVYRARDEKLGRFVAVKFLRDPLDPSHRLLFEREAKAIAALSKHPSIVQIYEWGEYKGHVYFALEYVEGNASRLLKEHTEGLPLAMAIRVALDSAEALSFAHGEGILHKDIKPANIMVEKGTGKAKLVDFGLAQFYGSQSIELSGHISGSPSYMSPEQASGKPLDERTDVFSLGVTLYQLLCNKKPFDGNNVGDIVSKVIAGLKTPLSQYRPDLPQGVIDVVEKAMAHDPKDRFQSAEEFAVALRAILRTLSRSGKVPETGVQARRSPGKSVVVAGLAVVAITAMVAILRFAGVAPAAPSVQAAALAEAKSCMDRGDFSQAEEKYAGVVGEFPDLADALYGLGWSKVRLGKLAEAKDAFEKTQAPVLRAEGMAGVAVEQEGESARSQLEQAREQGASPYVNTMLAKLDIQSGKDRDAVDRLQALSVDGFNYAWQYAESLQSLGQAYYHLGEFDKAAQAFRLLEQVSLPGQDAVASAYLRSISGRLDSQKRAEASAAAKRIRERMESGQVSDATADSWTSRPLTFFVLPTEPGATKAAVGTGLADLLPTLLGDSLDSRDSMNLVDRDLINEILAEQELSGLLSSAKDQLALGKVLGARLIISCRFGKLGNEEQLFVKLGDTETTERVPVKPIQIDLGANPGEVVEEAANRIWAAAAQAYPVQGRLYQQDGAAMVNLGVEVGVTEGMEFDVFRHLDTPPLEGVKAIAEGGLGVTTCKVRLEGVDTSELPGRSEEGWYVRGRQKA